MNKFLFYNKFIIFLYMFRELCAHHQEVIIVLYSTPVGGRPVSSLRVLSQPAHRTATYRCAVQYNYDLLMMST